MRRAAGGGRKARTYTPLEGLLLQIVNPKVLFYGLTLMSSFVVPWSDAPSLLLVVSALAGHPGLQFPVPLGAFREFIPAVLFAVRDAGQHPDGPVVDLLCLDHLRAFPTLPLSTPLTPYQGGKSRPAPNPQVKKERSAGHL